MTSEKSVLLEQRLDSLISTAPWAATPHPVLYAWKTADTSRANTTTLTDDPDLIINGLAASAVYEIRAQIIFAGGSGASENALDTDWSIPGGGSTINYCAPHAPYPFPSDGHITSYALQAGGWTAGTTGVSTSLGTNILGTLITVSSGSLKFQWAQHVSGGTATYIKLGSYISAQRMDA